MWQHNGFIIYNGFIISPSNGSMPHALLPCSQFVCSTVLYSPCPDDAQGKYDSDHQLFGGHVFIDMTLEYLLQEGSLVGTCMTRTDISFFSDLDFLVNWLTYSQGWCTSSFK